MLPLLLFEGFPFMKKKDHLLNYIIFVIILVVCVAVVLLLFFFLRYKKEDKVYEDIRESAVITSDSGERAINFDFLEEYSGDAVCSWITIPGTVIDYPLVHAEDNEYYLDHDAFGNPASSGAIFLNCYNNVSLSDPKTIIFGHSMKDGSMFHELHKYADSSFGNEHNTLLIYMLDGSIKQYHLLCEKKTTSDDAAVYTMFDMQDSGECAEYLASEADLVYSDPMDSNVLILSTCVKGKDRRVVVFQEDQI